MSGAEAPYRLIIINVLLEVEQTCIYICCMRLRQDRDTSVAKNRAASPLHAGMPGCVFLMWRTHQPLPAPL